MKTVVCGVCFEHVHVDAEVILNNSFSVTCACRGLGMSVQCLLVNLPPFLICVHCC